MRAVVCLLAGGAGSRIGGGKALRLLDGWPLIAHAHDNASRSGLPVWLCLRDRADAVAIDLVLGSSLPAIVDVPGVPGPLGAIMAALRAAERALFDAIVTLPCDAPFLPGDLVTRLIAALAFSDAKAAIARAGSQLHPVCAAWRVEALPTIEQEIAAGRLSMRGAADAVAAVAVDWANTEVFTNINTIEQLADAHALIDQKRRAQSSAPTPAAGLPADRRTSQSASTSGACAPES